MRRRPKDRTRIKFHVDKTSFSYKIANDKVVGGTCAVEVDLGDEMSSLRPTDADEYTQVLGSYRAENANVRNCSSHSQSLRNKSYICTTGVYEAKKSR